MNIYQGTVNVFSTDFQRLKMVLTTGVVSFVEPEEKG